MHTPDTAVRRGGLKATARRRGGGGAAGTVAASQGLTFAISPSRSPNPEGIRRRLAGAQQLPWRSGARRPDSSAGREPKGAIARGVEILKNTEQQPDSRMCCGRISAIRSYIRRKSDSPGIRKRDYRRATRQLISWKQVLRVVMTQMKGIARQRNALLRHRRAAFSGAARRGHPPPPGSRCPSVQNSEQDG